MMWHFITISFCLRQKLKESPCPSVCHLGMSTLELWKGRTIGRTMGRTMVRTTGRTAVRTIGRTKVRKTRWSTYRLQLYDSDFNALIAPWMLWLLFECFLIALWLLLSSLITFWPRKRKIDCFRQTWTKQMNEQTNISISWAPVQSQKEPEEGW